MKAFIRTGRMEKRVLFNCIPGVGGNEVQGIGNGERAYIVSHTPAKWRQIPGGASEVQGFTAVERALRTASTLTRKTPPKHI